MKILAAAALLALLTACQTAYVPPADGRVSVVDLVLFPSSFNGREVIVPGYLQWQAGSARLYFDPDHMLRTETRFVLNLLLPDDEAKARAARCDGQEVLVRGTVEATGDGSAVRSNGDIVC